MNKPVYYVGIDIASKTFTSAIGTETDKWRISAKPARFNNNDKSFYKFDEWLEQNNVSQTNAIICMEATGVYNDALAHYLYNAGYHISIEPPLAVKRAFDPVGHKTDPVDSTKICEYAYRYWDQLSMWKPRKGEYEEIRSLLAARELLVRQRVSTKNALAAIKKKVPQSHFLEGFYKQMNADIGKRIQNVEREIKRVMALDPELAERAERLDGVPGVGWILSVYFAITLACAPEGYTDKTIASYIGFVPYEKSSGTSLKRRPTSRHYGPSALRKLFRLAAMSDVTHNDEFKPNYRRKVAEGKPKQVLLNNVSNKLIRIMVAIDRNKTEYQKGYVSKKPILGS